VRRVAPLAALPLLCACSWLKERGHDFEDVWHLDVSLGPQVGATFRATHLVQAGLQAEGAGADEAPEDRQFDTAHWALAGRWRGLYKRVGAEYGIGPATIGPRWYRQDYRAEYEEEYRPQERTADEFGASFGLLLFGAEAGFRPAELADFLLGWFGADILADDGRAVVAEDAERWMALERARADEGEPLWSPAPKKRK
jgi:hypothetical protein